MNAYEELENDREKQEARDLAILNCLLSLLDKAWLPSSFNLPKAWDLFAEAAKFLAEKEKVRDAESKAYWDSPEGKARRAEAVARFEKIKKLKE
jgi:hypothetical protein